MVELIKTYIGSTEMLTFSGQCHGVLTGNVYECNRDFMVIIESNWTRYLDFISFLLMTFP